MKTDRRLSKQEEEVCSTFKSKKDTDGFLGRVNVYRFVVRRS